MTAALLVPALLPLLVPLGAAVATLLVRSDRGVLLAAWACVAALWLLAVLLALRPPAAWDAFSLWYCLLVLILSGLGLWVSIHYIGTEYRHGEVDLAGLRRYFALFELMILFLIAVGATTNYLGIWAAVEGTTLASVPLVAFPGGRAVEAAWKYVVVTGVGGLLGFAGTVLMLYGAGVPLGGWTLISAGAALPAVLAPAARTAVEAGLVLAVVGYGSKAGLVPFHTWLPDAHSEAPAPVSAMLSGLKISGGLYALLRLTALSSAAIGPGWSHGLLLITGLLSLGLASIAIAGQRDLKRMFAYSSIEHMGVIALGAAFGGVGLLGALLHMWTHGFGKTALFFGSGNVRLSYGATSAPSVRGVLAVLPLTGSALALGGAAIVGLPPFGLFWSEWLVLLGGVEAHEFLWVALALACLLVTLLGFGLRLPDLLMGAPPSAGARPPAGAPAHRAAGSAPAGHPAAGPASGLPAAGSAAALQGAAAEPALGTLPVGLTLAGCLVAGLLIPAAMHGTWMAAAQILGGGGVR